MAENKGSETYRAFDNARICFQKYREQTYWDYHANSDKTVFMQMICDLRYYAKIRKWDWAEVLDGAAVNFDGTEEREKTT